MNGIDKQLISEFIDASVNDQRKAESIFKKNPKLCESRWINGETILHFLAVEGYVDAVRFLCRLGFDVNATNKFDDSPLIDIAALGNLEMAKLLIDEGADTNALSPTKDNVLHCAVQSGNSELVDLLLRKGAKADYVTDIGETIFDAIIDDPKQRQSILRIFDKHGIIHK